MIISKLGLYLSPHFTLLTVVTSRPEDWLGTGKSLSAHFPTFLSLLLCPFTTQPSSVEPLPPCCLQLSRPWGCGMYVVTQCIETDQLDLLSPLPNSKKITGTR